MENFGRNGLLPLALAMCDGSDKTIWPKQCPDGKTFRKTEIICQFKSVELKNNLTRFTLDSIKKM